MKTQKTKSYENKREKLKGKDFSNISKIKKRFEDIFPKYLNGNRLKNKSIY